MWYAQFTKGRGGQLDMEMRLGFQVENEPGVSPGLGMGSGCEDRCQGRMGGGFRRELPCGFPGLGQECRQMPESCLGSDLELRLW